MLRLLLGNTPTLIRQKQPAPQQDKVSHLKCLKRMDKTLLGTNFLSPQEREGRLVCLAHMTLPSREY